MDIKKIPTLYKMLFILLVLVVIIYVAMPFTDEKDLTSYDETSQLMLSPLDAKVKKVHLIKGDEFHANTLLIELNHDDYIAEKTLAMANIELIKAGKEPSAAPLSLNIKNVITSKESIYANAKTKEENYAKEYTYWSNELAKNLLQLRKPNVSALEREKLSIARDNAKLMQESTDEKYAQARQESKDALEDLERFKQTQKDLNRSYRDVSIWEQKIHEAEHYIKLSDIYSEAKIIILEVYTKENDEIKKGQELYKFAILP